MPLDEQPVNIEIRYPVSWMKPAREGLAEKLDDAALAWLDKHGLLTNPENRRNAETCDLGQAVARSNPTAQSEDRLTFYARFLGLWFLYEDSIEGIGTQDGYPSLISKALTAGFSSELLSATPTLTPWLALGSEMAENMSPQWCRRFTARFEAWQYSVADEAILFRREGLAADLDTYLTVRLHTLGMYVATDMIEYTLGRELPPEVFADPDVTEIYRLISALCLVDNDLHCITKDRVAGFPNLVSATARDRGLSEVQSCARLLDWHDQLVSRFMSVERRLRSSRTDIDIGWWLDCVHFMITGLCLWHRNAPRYQVEHRTAEGRRIRLVLGS